MAERQRRRGVLTAAIGAALAWSASAEAAPAPRLDELFAAAGLRPATAAAAAPDFTLPRLSGGEAKLSELGGRWIVLTFWAAWCGPCRAELPSLEEVHLARRDAGIEVVGVALDRDPAAARGLAEELGLTFPSFHDGEGRVAALYGAGSIPTSYLIDPGGEVVAHARGARDWRRLLPVLDAALEARPPRPRAGARFGPEETLALPAVTRPPAAEVELTDGSPRPRRPFELLIRLRWAGDFEEYLPHPPWVHLPEGVEQRGVTAETSSRDGRHLVTYRVTLEALEEGRFALDPIELRYTPAGAAEPVAARIAGPTVETVGRGWGRAATLAGGALAVGLLGLLAVRRRRPGREAESPERRFEELRRIYSEARAARLAGDAEGTLTRVAALEERMGKIGGEERAELEGRLEAVRFGGRVPSTVVMDQLLRRAERRLEALRPDPRAARRRALKLRRAAGDLGGGSK
ncbi:MAG: TlpA disulfide reductase family protein [Thermoanaerobaculia bacterium]|nr:TlpA disulfide reductase family protein [Thermoanaerobaculia bacterium]